MPLNYLEGNNDNIYALKNMGSTFSDAIIGMAEARAKRQQLMQQAAMESAYLQLARQREARESQMQQQTMGQHQQSQQAAATIARLRGIQQAGPQAMMGMVKDPVSGPQLMGDLRQANVIPQGGFQISQPELINRIAAAISGQLYGQAAMSPAEAGRLTMPVVGGPGEIGRDPQQLNRILFQNPQIMTPYQQGMLQRYGPLDEARIAAERSRASDYSANTAERERHNREMEARPTEAMNNAELMKTKNTFDSEEDARKGGKKAGDVIYIRGVGKVQLN